MDRIQALGEVFMDELLDDLKRKVEMDRIQALGEVFMDELLDDLKDMIDYYDGDVPTWDYRPDAKRRVDKYVRDYTTLIDSGVDIRGKAF